MDFGMSSQSPAGQVWMPIATEMSVEPVRDAFGRYARAAGVERRADQ